MDVSENSGTPKSSILIGFSIINHPFWGTPIFGNTHMLSIFMTSDIPTEIFPNLRVQPLRWSWLSSAISWRWRVFGRWMTFQAAKAWRLTGKNLGRHPVLQNRNRQFCPFLLHHSAVCFQNLLREAMEMEPLRDVRVYGSPECEHPGHCQFFVWRYFSWSMKLFDSDSWMKVWFRGPSLLHPRMPSWKSKLSWIASMPSLDTWNIFWS